MTAAILGLGATGSQVARQLSGRIACDLAVYDTAPQRVSSMLEALPDAQEGTSDPSADVVVLALPGGQHVAAALRALARGAHVVSLSDHPGDVEGLLSLDRLATAAGLSVLVGVGFSPGLTCLMARHAGNALDAVDMVAVAKAGTGGPVCARQHHRALQKAGSEWIDGSWQLRRGGSGRELAWFPEPIGSRDCYRAWLADPILLQRCFPDATRISARMAATRRDRMTARLPMLRPPHPDGGPGALRVEVRGRRGRAVETIVYGVTDHPAAAAGTVATEAVRCLLRGSLPVGAWGLGEIDEPLELLRALFERGLRLVTYESSGRPRHS